MRSRSGAVAPDDSDDAPKLSEEQLAEFEPPTFRFTKRRD